MFKLKMKLFYFILIFDFYCNKNWLGEVEVDFKLVKKEKLETLNIDNAQVYYDYSQFCRCIGCC